MGYRLLDLMGEVWLTVSTAITPSAVARESRMTLGPIWAISYVTSCGTFMASNGRICC